MTTRPQRPPAFARAMGGQGTDRDAPGEGRLASSGPSGLTRGGNSRTKFLPKLVARKTDEGYLLACPTTRLMVGRREQRLLLMPQEGKRYFGLDVAMC
jgi:hypothetical protein